MSMTNWTHYYGNGDHHPTTRTVSTCSVCPECASADAGSARAVGFNDLSVVPEEEPQSRSNVESPCSCEECKPEPRPTVQEPPKSVPMTQTTNTFKPNMENNGPERAVDVLVHDAPNPPQFFESVTSPAYHVTPPPPPGFIISPYQVPRFHNGGNVDDLLGDVQATPIIETVQTFVQQNSVFMCNTRKITRQCSCQKHEEKRPPDPPPKSFVTEKNIELTYDYPRSTRVQNGKTKPEDKTTTEVASTVVFVERRIPVRPKKFDFFFRSRSAPVGDNEEPIYATVNKLPKRLRRIELANLEKEVAYKNAEPDSSTRTEITVKSDSESAAAVPDDDSSPSEREKSAVPQRPESPKAKKRKRFSLTFKKRERKRREKKKVKEEVSKNGAPKNGVPKNGVSLECENERLIEHEEAKHRLCSRHRPRNTLSSSSSGPRYKRDSYQEMTTSHSEHERTNSVCSSVNSSTSVCTHKSRKFSAPPRDGSIPWCGCWGAGCL